MSSKNNKVQQFINFDVTSLVKYKLTDNVLSNVALSGSLRSSSCRSAVWRLLLRCLPYESNEWELSLSRNRNFYRVLKKSKLIDPRDDRYNQDPQLNNPLAPVEQNPWNRFFEDNDLRDMINKDVTRTFPEIDFFQQPRIQKMMSDILLVYAKENPYINYKQGMHEILAPIIFVIYSDIESFEHSVECNELKCLNIEEEDVLKCLFNKDYLEHDSYNLFTAFMLEVGKYYEDSEQSDDVKHENGPYMRVQDSMPSSRIMDDLQDIGKLLEETDPTLAKHLNNLDIPPQLYGIRWLRLLFGRELPLHDLLFLWDVIIIDRPIAPFVKCIFVSLLVQVRQLLLSTDYGGCLQYLMRYPPIADMDSFIKLARHYRNPKKNARPIIKSNNFSHITVTGQSHPNKIHGRTMKVQPDRVVVEDSSPSILGPVIEKVKNSIKDRSSQGSVQSSPRRDPKTTTGIEPWGREIQLMEEQISCIQTRLNEREIVCAQVSKSLQICAKELKENDDSETIANISSRLVELSRILVSSAPFPNHSNPNPNEISKPKLIQKSNEMIELSSTTRPPPM